MKMGPKCVSRLVLVLAHVFFAAAPLAAHAVTCGGIAPTPPLPQCAVAVCLAYDNVWDLLPKPFGTICGPNGLGFCDGTGVDCVTPEFGTVYPLYMVTDVRYMPPGLSSTVSYSSSQSIGTATSVSKSFSNSNGAMISVGYNGILSTGSASVSLTNTYTEGSTDSVSVMRTMSSFNTMACGGPFCGDEIDHRNDQIVILARPGVRVAAFASNIALPPDKNQVTWGLDLSSAVEIPLDVGYLNGTKPWPVERENYLQTNFGIYPVEYPKILSATGYGYALPWATVPNYGAVETWGANWKPNRGRFQYYSNKPFVPGSQNTSGDSITNLIETKQEVNYSTSYTVSATVVGSAGIGAVISAAASGTSSWTWTNSTSSSITKNTATNMSYTLNSPQADYTGKQTIVVYIDKLYQTFVFSTCSALPDPDLMIGCANGPPLPSAATGLVANASSAQSPIVVSWTPVMGATSYSLQRSTAPSSGFVSITPTNSPFNGFGYADTNAINSAIPYYYKVTASNETGTGPESQVAVTPAAPTGLAASVTGSTVNLSWSQAAAADTYTVWRSTTSGTGFATLPGSTGLTTSQFAAAFPPIGSQYSFVVTASSSTGASAYSNQVQVLAAPATPTGVTTSSGDRLVSVRWNAAAGATSYSVERAASGSAFATFPGSTNLSTTYVVDSGLANGATYYYRVMAVNATGPSAYSTVVSGTPQAPPPPDPPPSCNCRAGYSCKCGDSICYSAAQQCN